MSEEIMVLVFWPSPFATRVKIALQEKGITNYEARHEDVLGNKSSLLSQMNPVHKKIPVLIHNGKPVCESVVIVEYIDEAWKDRSPSLMPVGPYERAQARFWADYNDKTFFNLLRKLWRQKDEIDEEGKKDFIDCLKLLEEQLGDKAYFGGNNFGYLDVILIPNHVWFYSYQKFTKSNIEAECPRLIAWAKRCMERDSVKNSLPNELEIYEYILELKRRFGTG